MLSFFTIQTHSKKLEPNPRTYTPRPKPPPTSQTVAIRWYYKTILKGNKCYIQGETGQKGEMDVFYTNSTRLKIDKPTLLYLNQIGLKTCRMRLYFKFE